MGKQASGVTLCDLLDRPLSVGDRVAAAVVGHGLKVATVVQLCKKQVRIEYPAPGDWRSVDGRRQSLADPRDTVLLDGEALTLYLLKKSG